MFKRNFINEILSNVELEKISEVIKQQELKTSGELRVAIKEKRNLFERKKSIRELAIKEFYRLGMDRTRERSGILFFILLKEKQFYILPDEGITKKLTQDFWDGLALEVQKFFKEKNFYEGIILVLRECGKVLEKHFPRKPDDINELSDSVAIV